MKMKQAITVIAGLWLTVFFSKADTAGAAEIKVWTARAIATVLSEVGPRFERRTGHKLVISSDLPTSFAQRANAGEPFDILISGSAPVDEWIKDGKIIAETRTDIARSGIGVEVRKGARKPDISSVEAFKRALLDAKSVGYLRVGSGVYIAGLLERLGIAGVVNSKATRPESDIVSELVAKGEVELGMVVITQILWLKVSSPHCPPGLRLASFQLVKRENDLAPVIRVFLRRNGRVRIAEKRQYVFPQPRRNVV